MSVDSLFASKFERVSWLHEHFEILFGDNPVFWKLFDLLCSLLDKSLPELLKRLEWKERVPSDSSFDWKVFLDQHALLPEQVSKRYALMFPWRYPRDDFNKVTRVDAYT
ncbi:hypothetical protein GAYE_SCF7681MG6998 [Galdieria yellowstonensis]|uniref:Uncharacterized protein n=1 Tax=Galdieria yellowstonensis TaxID=3028027 RepID=A0AAV9IP73_9RHOD|nr:hypothetical protein GAYE_SCF7681MG6998 [Galdieria yellowstonensis]